MVTTSRPLPLLRFLKAKNWSLAALDAAVKFGFAELLFPNGRIHVREIK